MSDLSPECAPKRTSVDDHSEHYRRLGGDDLRQLPLKLRKTNLAQLRSQNVPRSSKFTCHEVLCAMRQ